MKKCIFVQKITMVDGSHNLKLCPSHKEPLEYDGRAKNTAFFDLFLYIIANYFSNIIICIVNTANNYFLTKIKCL